MENEEHKKIEEQINEIEERINDPELCAGTASVWSRCTGYYRPVELYNWGKRREYLERIEYQLFGTTGHADKSWVEKLLNGEKKNIA
jgi:hypothetical protein